MVVLPESGSLEETPLPRLLLDLYRARFDGALHLKRESLEKSFLLRKGVPVFSESNRTSESLGVQLMDAGRISRDDYARVVRSVQASRCKEGKALLDLDLIDPRGLFLALKDQVRARLIECFGWAHGEFRVDDSEVPPEDAQPFRADVYALLQEGLETHWSVERILVDLGPRMKLYPSRNARLSRIQSRLLWDDAVQHLVDALDGSQSLWKALQLANTPRALSAAWLLDAVGALDFRESPSAGSESAPRVEREIEIVTREAGGTPPARQRPAPPREAADKAPDAAAVERLLREIDSKLSRSSELTHYELLDLSSEASPEEIRLAYLRAAKTHHPDALTRAGLDAEARRRANKLFGEISKAYAVLSDPKRRRDYDAARSGGDLSLDANQLATAETLYRKGEVLLRQGNFKGALEYLRPAVELWPDDAAYRSALGWALYKKHPSEPESARDQLRRAAAMDPEDGVSLFRLGVVLRSLGEEKEAADLLERAQQIDPRLA